ncbi:hypothetical protein ACYOEI_07290 [Singulisphaera rosea]
MIHRIRPRRRRLALTSLALVASAVAWASASAGDSPEVRELKEQVARQAKRISSLEVSYTLETTSNLKPAELLKLVEYRNQMYLANDEWTVAFKGEMRFTHQLQPARVEYLSATDEYGLVPPQPVDPKAPEFIQSQQKQIKKEYDQAIATMKALEATGVPRQKKKDPGLLDPMERDVTRGYNGRTLWMRRPRDARSNEVQVWPLLSKPMHWFGRSTYLCGVGLQPADTTSKGHSTEWTMTMCRLADWFAGHTYAIEKTEAFDGSTCVVLKGSLNSLLSPTLLTGDMADRIWIDRDHGFVMRKRELSKDGRVSMRWENSELREVDPGLWLPMTVRQDRFAEDAPLAWQGKPVVTEVIRVKTIELNNVPDDRFDMVPRKNDVVEDLRGIF